MDFTKYVYTVDPTTKVVTTTEAAADIADIINPSVTLATSVAMTTRAITNTGTSIPTYLREA